ncbi:hypothetical protein EVG20_g1310 [Dentipellis fragilis]|uniref:Uncharacterized protein n=1 Tax=Dentipellis fragilis TaxID=205917 RepID=A0A4Y9ZB61_9AGAM|nr:hypothetical protein EVG20_g1310 [Dentipellis fragilis]
MDLPSPSQEADSSDTKWSRPELEVCYNADGDQTSCHYKHTVQKAVAIGIFGTIGLLFLLWFCNKLRKCCQAEQYLRSHPEPSVSGAYESRHRAEEVSMEEWPTYGYRGGHARQPSYPERARSSPHSSRANAYGHNALPLYGSDSRRIGTLPGYQTTPRYNQTVPKYQRRSR